MKFKGKIALWFWIIFLGGESLILYKMAESIFSGHDTEDIIVLAISFVIYTLVFLPIVARNYVLIEDGKLKLFFGFSTDVIDISEIKEIRSTCSPIASSAASLDRLVIKGRRQEMIVSVKDKQKFLEELKKRKEINVPDARAAALFILNGEIGLINDSEMNSDQKLEILKEFVLKVLK